MRTEATITLPVGKVVRVFDDAPRNRRVSLCKLCDTRFVQYGDDPEDMAAEIVCRMHVVPIHGGALNESRSDIRGDSASQPSVDSRSDVHADTTTNMEGPPSE